MAWKGKTILIVDDDPIIFKDIRRKLKNKNVELIWAKDGFEAISICKNNNNIDLVIMDIQMPKMSGFETATKIKQMKVSLPIIGQTSFVDPNNIANSIKAGMVDFAIKPIETSKIESLMLKYVFS